MTDASAHAVIKAEYSDYRRVKGRKVIQLVCEVPIEQAATVHERLGEPGAHDKQIWVAIALLNETGQAKEAPKEKRPRERGLSEQCAMYCKRPDFQEWLGIEQTASAEFAEDLAACEVRERLDIESRSELDTNPEAAERWERMKTSFDYRNAPALEKQK